MATLAAHFHEKEKRLQVICALGCQISQVTQGANYPASYQESSPYYLGPI